MSARRIGIVGGGQLARMLALAGHPLGLACEMLDPAAAPSAASVVAQHVHGAFEDHAALDRLAADCSVITFDFENVTAEPLAHLAARVPVRPPPRALAVAQDRLLEKRHLESLGAAVAPYRELRQLDDLHAAVEALGLPLLVKTRRMGYDGKGQWRLASRADVPAVWRQLAGQAAIAEAWIPFERELSLLAVRAADGEMAFYPLTANCHDQGVLAFSVAPARVAAELQRAAEQLARDLLQSLDYVGVLAIELFDCGGHLLVNEIAPRVHNSGHWSIEGADCSQFENHLRAIAGLPLGSTRARGASLMVNVLGHWPEREALLRVPGVHLHDYLKAPRPGRKIGHLCLSADTPEALLERGLVLLQLAGFAHRAADLAGALGRAAPGIPGAALWPGLSAAGTQRSPS